VPVRLVVEHLGGLAADARFMTATGADPLPEGIDPFEVKVERSVPAEKGMKDCLLAWEMNGEPIPLTHGGPLRLIVPGYYGCNQTKYVQTLAFGPEQTQAKIQREDYRMQPLGAKGEPHQASLWEMDLKSWVVGPGGDGEPVLQGKVQLHGVAFSEGKHRLARAELSVDGGKTWKEARWVGPDLGPYAWRNFALEVSLAPGAYEVASRVTDEAGNVQAEARVENERGYGNNSWRDMMMALEVVERLPPKAPKASPSAAAQAPAAAPSGPRATLSEAGERGRKLFVQDASPPCGACHTLGDAASQGAVGPNLDQLKPDAERVKRAVTQGIGAMPPYQGRLTEGQVSDLAAYLIEATRGK
jgi:sulfite dehydrogenase